MRVQISVIRVITVTLIVWAQPAKAQSDDTSPAFASGVTVGTMHFSGGRTDQGLAVALQYSPREWFTLSAAPGFGRTSYAGTSSAGLTDMPISAGAWHRFDDAPLEPSVSGSLYSSLSVGGSSGPGVGHSIVGASAWLGAWVTQNARVGAGLARPLTANSGNSSLSLESSYTLGRARSSVGFSSELGTPDSGAVLSRSVSAGVAYTVRSPLTLTVDGSHGLTTGAPSWTLSLGFGTAFAGVSPVTMSSSLQRMRNVFGARAQSANGFSGASRGACKRAGTC